MKNPSPDPALRRRVQEPGVMKLVNREFQRSANLSLVMREVRDREPISRIEIARRLGLNRSTVTNITQELIARGLLEMTAEGEAAPRGGRKPELLGISRSFGAVIGMDVQPDGYRVVVSDLAGGIVDRVSERYVRPLSFRDSFFRAYHGAEERADLWGIPAVGAVVGIPGYVDPVSGRIVRSVGFDISMYDFAGEIASVVPIPVLAENDANCCAWGELKTARGRESFLFLLVKFHDTDAAIAAGGGLGVGFGIALEGAVHSGSHHSAGEFMSVFREKGLSGTVGIPAWDLSRIRTDPGVRRRVVREIFLNLGMMVTLLDPDRVVIGGDLRGFPSIVAEEWRNILVERFALSPERYPYRMSWFGEDDVAAGAAGMFLEKLFSVPGLGGQADYVSVGWERILGGRGAVR